MTNRRDFFKKVTTGVAALSMAKSSMGSAAQSKGKTNDPHQPKPTTLDRTFLENGALVSIDFQPYTYHLMTEEQMPKSWRAMGMTPEDVNHANQYLVETALPNARRVADACRKANLAMIFVHWGYLFRDAMDLDPVIYNSFLADLGPDTSKWPHHISAQDSKPAEELAVQEGEYVIAKTSQDAFSSSSIGYVLQNLKIRHIVFIGGHTGACLGKSVKSAIKLGYRTLCVQDATFDAFASKHKETLKATGYHHVMTTLEFEEFVRKS